MSSAGLGWPAIFVIISMCFVAGVVLNALTFQFSYNCLRKLYSIKRPEQANIECNIFNSIFSDKLQSHKFFQNVDREMIKSLNRENKYRVCTAFDEKGLFNALRDEFAPFIDFQLGLAISFLFIMIIFPFWLSSTDYELLEGLSKTSLWLVITAFFIIVVLILLRSVYENYKKLRETRLVVIMALACSKHASDD